MKVIDLLKILAEACRHNANAEIHLMVNGNEQPLFYCENHFGGKVFLLVGDYQDQLMKDK